MNFKVALIAVGLSSVLAGMAQAATVPDSTVSKKITLTAQINDAMFVSKSDGSTWYGTEDLEPLDYTQKAFTKVLPVRVWTKGSEFNVSLAQPLKLSNGTYEMAGAKVTIAHSGGDSAVTFGAPLKVTQTITGNGGYDEIHNLKIDVNAPVKTANGPSTNGSYSGDLVMLFEPVAAVGP
ncbi:CS1 type fimbrial major subunit [Pseudomonas paralactis]|uniref:CS1 type fimbrial major subunit n=1 Tax=Pseudomonas paralactis TaxID=1615673 RepID=UPI0034D517F3